MVKDIIENESASEEENIDDQDFYNQEIIDFHEYNEEDMTKEKDLIKNSENYKLKIKKSGVIYISYIPEGLTINGLRKKLEKYGIKRIYLKPLSGKKNHFKEGWLEFESKLMAKLCEYELNGQPIGGKKRDALSDELWTFKYLHKFKWHHLMDKLHMKQKTREQQLKTTISQAQRENNFVMDSMIQSKRKKMRDELNPDSIDDYRRTVKQTKSVKDIK